MSKEDFRVGEIIYALPTGNNARACRDIIKFLVVKIGRKYVSLTRVGSSTVTSYDPVTGATQNAVNSGYGLNAGYKFFESLQDLKNYEEAEELKKEILKYFRHNYRLDLTFDQLRAIKEVIGL